MVANCPSSWDDALTVQKCISANYSADPATALPVLDITENVTYANLYCAMCHNKSRDLHHWSLKIQVRPGNSISLHDIQNADVIWEAIPVGDVIPDKCILTPPEANTEPGTKSKRLCRAYANSITVEEDDVQRFGKHFKNPHCANISGQDLLLNRSAACWKNGRFPPRLPTMLFVFSVHGKNSVRHREETVRLEVSCPRREIYDPFKGRCLPVHSGFHSQYANKTQLCRGLSFSSNEFLLLINNSAFIIPHQKVYSNDSYILVNHTLILCSNFSRNYNKTVTKAGKDKPPMSKSLTLRIITYVGFSLSIISLLFLLVTYILFTELRTYPGKMVMHLSCAMIAMQSVYFASDPDVVSSAVCAVMGALLHYFILAVFLWMGAFALNTLKTFTNPSK